MQQRRPHIRRCSTRRHPRRIHAHTRPLRNMRQAPVRKNITQGITLDLDEGEAVSHIVCVVVVERIDSFDQEVRIASTPQTGRITELGALSEALEQVRMPLYYDDGDDE